MINESTNLNGQDTHLAISNQIHESQILPFLDDHLHPKNPRYHLIPSTDINDQIILKFAHP